MTQPNVTIIVVPREEFGLAQRSLESIYENTRCPFNLVYIDGNSPKAVRRYLQAQSQARGFHLIRTEHYLTPNQARNIGVKAATTKHVVFVDNNMLVRPNWLSALVDCSDRTGAWVVSPLTMENETFDRVHHISGQLLIKTLADGRRWLIERRPYMRLPLDKVTKPFESKPHSLAEFHCVLVRRAAFDTIGPLDENLLSIAEETDFCFSILAAGGTIYCEPKSVVSYILPTQIGWRELPYFFLRWSDRWQIESTEYFAQKYSISRDTPTLKNYQHFIHSQRNRAFAGQPEQPLKPTFSSTKLSTAQKIHHCLRKVLRRRINARAMQLLQPQIPSTDN